MNQVQEISLESLQPTQIDLTPGRLEYYSSVFPLFRETSPEIWIFEGKRFIADGHNQLYYDYSKRNKRTVYLRCFTPENCGVGPEVYSWIIDDLLKKAEETRSQGVYSIKDLKAV